ncbi:MAG TPA: bifunctional DNA-formamidopyrimidine glycosylase/DNA-(apurinic or apyrimidinic site) lyase [Syntrophomonadaceae bacterium]|nr:bifunctional DNA-formamidopyrimidine glycosylase/DNA-(apurinic or apyrimidinic site) lyase [Syntrophomonadaceae bacterium]
MPELPEVETICRNIAVCTGARLIDVDLRRPDMIRQADYDVHDLIGLDLCAVRRRGKYLHLCWEDDHHLIFHLGMSGRFYKQERALAITEDHVHLVMDLDTEERLLYLDPRRFGGIWLLSSPGQLFARLGVEPLSEDFTAEYLQHVCRKRKTAIKNLLLNQQLIAGIGNIYADEALFGAGLRPDRPAGELSGQEIGRLQAAIVEVLRRSIENHGTSFRDYRDGLNQQGENQFYLAVYGREGKACRCCGQDINKMVLGGRGTHYCPQCQV